MVEAFEKTAAEKVAAQPEQKRLQAVTEQAADEAADRREKEVKGGARRGNKKLTKWVSTAEALPRKECARQGCHKKAVFTCGASGPLLCSKSCQHRHKNGERGKGYRNYRRGQAAGALAGTPDGYAARCGVLTAEPTSVLVGAYKLAATVPDTRKDARRGGS